MKRPKEKQAYFGNRFHYEVSRNGAIEQFHEDDWEEAIDGVTGLNLSGHRPYHMNPQIARFNEELDDPLEF